MVDPILVGLFNYTSQGISLFLFLTLSIFVILLTCKLAKRSQINFIHSPRSKLKRIPYFTRLCDLKFTPSIFFPSGNLQTVVLPFLSFKENSRKHLWTYNYKREMLSLSDGGQIALDWAIPRNPETEKKILEKDAPILAVVPGLTGHNDDLYMVSTAMEAVKNGYQLVMINHRGCSNSKLSTPKFYCAGSTNDLEQAVEFISSNNPGKELYLLGFSVGANILTNYLGKLGKHVPAKAAMCIGNPYDLLKCSEKLGKKMFGLYNHVFTKNLVRKYNQHIDTLRPLEEKLNMKLEDALQSMRTVRQLDEIITIRQFNYTSVDEYYASISSVNQLLNIEIPTLFLNSLDDPIIDKSAIPFEKFRQNDNIMLATTRGGGHIGFLHGIVKIEQWFTQPMFEFLGAFKSSKL